MNCPQCQENKANHDPEYGILPCDICQIFHNQIPKPSQQKAYDFASPTTKKHRKEYGAEMFQPYINGVLSKEFVETWGTDKLYGVTKKDIKNAKYVYQGMSRHHKMIDAGKKKAQEIYGGKPKNDYLVKEKK